MRSTNGDVGFLVAIAESLHQVTILMGQISGLPGASANIDGFRPHTYSFINEAGERQW